MIVLFGGHLLSCDILDPIDENRLTPEYIGTDPASAEGLLLHGYTALINQYEFSECGTDDAVNNQFTNGYKRMATGELSALYNPASRWWRYERIFYINKFIDVLNQGSVQWHEDKEINRLFNDRLKGEALALRGLYHFYLLQAHAGIGASGDLLGITYYENFIPSDGEFNIPRLSFESSVEKIITDYNDAIELLPLDYSDSPSDVLPKYSNIEFSKYKVANGGQYVGRISGRIVKALKARLALFAASPSFLNGGGYYEIAANIASELLDMKGGITGLVPDGIEFYNDDADKDRGEILWRSTAWNSSWLEEDNFPPSRNGRGRINPTHNLVKAFPMKNGFPATEENGYNPQDPYFNRDPRLAKYIVFNGSNFAGTNIITGVGGGVDRLDSVPEKSTLTGYYLKKLLRPEVRINDDGTVVQKLHFDVFFRYTELFLILAESANEIGGPDYKVASMSARDIIGALRRRAGITQPDVYLGTISSKEEMRELIRNERRIELCFEGFRFWDIRRWGLPLNEPAEGYFFDGLKYINRIVEPRNYPSYATYMPIPYDEILKFSELEQNRGWEN